MDMVKIKNNGIATLAVELPPFPFYVRGNSGALWKVTGTHVPEMRRIPGSLPMVDAELIADGNIGMKDTLFADQLLAIYGEFNEQGERIKMGYMDDEAVEENRILSRLNRRDETKRYRSEPKQHTNLNS